MPQLPQADLDVEAVEGAPAPPGPTVPTDDWEHIELYRAVTRALYALPSLFESELMISGILATDLHTLNSSLGATLEVQVVDGLNRIRRVWDPDEQYALYRFVRQPQTFPDVTLRAASPDVDPAVLMGIELKGWYVLAKEREPTFRFKVTPAVCQAQDLLVVYPWALQNVLSGSPRLFEPFVVSARHAGEYRNWYWEHGRDTEDDPGVTLSTATEPYPEKSDRISDAANYDAGGNFGRIARYGIMDEYLATLSVEQLAGIPIQAWQRFLRLFSQDWNDEGVLRALGRMGREAEAGRTHLDAATIAAIEERLTEIAALAGDD